MKTCIYCGRTYPEDVRVCPACGLNLEQAPENILGPIEIDVEPETWIPPHQQTPETRTPPTRQMPEALQLHEEQPPIPPQQSAAPTHAAAEGLSPELMRMFRRNQHMYIFRMLLLIVVALCLLLSLLLNLWQPYSSMDMTDIIGMSLVTVAPGLLGGLWGLFSSLARLRKTPGELAAQVSASPAGLISLFSAHERIILKAPVVGVLLGAGAVYAAYLILSNTPLMHIVYNLSMLGRIGGKDWWYALDKANGGIACSAMLIFCLSYPIRTVCLFLLRGKVIKTP